MSDLDDIPVCSCPSARKLLNREEKQKLVQFLIGLNDNYNVIRGNTLIMNPLPSINQIYSMLIQEEKRREVKSVGHFLIESASLSVDVHKGHQTKNLGFKNHFSRPEGRFEKNKEKRAT